MKYNAEQVAFMLHEAIDKNREYKSWHCSTQHLMTLVERVVAEEREACAVIAETPVFGEADDITMEAKDRVAKAIRARGNVATNDTSQERVDKTSESVHEPVARVGLDLDNMAEAFHRVIEEHHSRKNPFHDPVNGDAMIALRELRGLISYMKRNTAPPQRTWVGLTDGERNGLWRVIIGWGDPSHDDVDLMKAIEAALRSKNT